MRENSNQPVSFPILTSVPCVRISAKVLAHEISHVLLRHGAEKLSRFQVWHWLAVILLLFGMDPYLIGESVPIRNDLFFPYLITELFIFMTVCHYDY